MKDCRITLEIRSGKLTVKGENVSMEELATLSGYFQSFVGTEALKRGMDIDQIKCNLLDMCLAAGDTVEELAKNYEEGMDEEDNA